MLRQVGRVQSSCSHCTPALLEPFVRGFASKGGKNVAKGDTLVSTDEKEISNAAKSDELAKPENLQFNTITTQGAAFVGDLRSTSGLGLGDGLTSHTAKWLQVRSEAQHS